jgi:hypothetical protein
MVSFQLLATRRDRALEHKQELFVHLQQRWKDLLDAEFDLLLYDPTSTNVESQGALTRLSPARPCVGAPARGKRRAA